MGKCLSSLGRNNKVTPLCASEDKNEKKVESSTWKRNKVAPVASVCKGKSSLSTMNGTFAKVHRSDLTGAITRSQRVQRADDTSSSVVTVQKYVLIPLYPFCFLFLILNLF